MPTHLLTRITAKEILCRTYCDTKNCCLFSDGLNNFLKYLLTIYLAVLGLS